MPNITSKAKSNASARSSRAPLQQRSIGKGRFNAQATDAQKEAAIALVKGGMTPWAVTEKENAPYPMVGYSWLHYHTQGRAKKGEEKRIPATKRGPAKLASNAELEERILKWADQQFVDNNSPPGRLEVMRKAATVDAIMAARDGREPRWPNGMATKKWWDNLRKI